MFLDLFASFWIIFKLNLVAWLVFGHCRLKTDRPPVPGGAAPALFHPE
jgi:hypothetical protein